MAKKGSGQRHIPQSAFWEPDARGYCLECPTMKKKKKNRQKGHFGNLSLTKSYPGKSKCLFPDSLKA